MSLDQVTETGLEKKYVPFCSRPMDVKNKSRLENSEPFNETKS